MSTNEPNLWVDIGNKCLTKAPLLLDSKTFLTFTTVETVKLLVEIAVEIDMLNLRWAEQNRFSTAVFRGSVQK